MKRIFGRSGREKEDEIQDVSLDILLAHKEDVVTKLKNEYKAFLARKVLIEKELVQVETRELELREEDLANKKDELGKINDTNKSHQEKFEEQLQILEIKLEEHKSLHYQSETKLQGEIDQMFAELEDVKKLLQKKIDEYEQDWISENSSGDHLHMRNLDDPITTRTASMFVEVGDVQTEQYLSENEQD